MLELPLVGTVGAYWVGVLGSAVVEIFAAARSCAEIEGSVPPRYKRPFYLVTRLFVAFAAGVLPLVFDAQTALAAFYLGVSAPVVLDRLARGLLPSPPAPNALSNSSGAGTEADDH